MSHPSYSQRGLVWAALLLAAVVSPAFSAELAFTDPPVLSRGHWHVPARQLAECMGASIAWKSGPPRVTVTYKGASHTWTKASGRLWIRHAHAFLPVNEVCQAFGFSVTRPEREPILDLRAGARHATIPVGWALPGLPRGISHDERQIWRLLVELGKPWAVPGLIDRPYDIRVVSRWASARLHPLNTVTDDVTVLLEKRGGQWRIITLGTDIVSGPNGRLLNYGIPANVLKRLKISE